MSGILAGGTADGYSCHSDTKFNSLRRGVAWDCERHLGHTCPSPLDKKWSAFRRKEKLLWYVTSSKIKLAIWSVCCRPNSIHQAYGCFCSGLALALSNLIWSGRDNCHHQGNDHRVTAIQGRIQPKTGEGLKKISTLPVKLCCNIRKFLDIFAQIYKNVPIFRADLR